MKVTKAYVLVDGDYADMVFLNESDRNEMALAFFQAEVYERFMVEYNWYGESLEATYLPGYEANPLVENPLVALWTWRLYEIEETIMEDIRACEIAMVEG